MLELITICSLTLALAHSLVFNYISWNKITALVLFLGRRVAWLPFQQVKTIMCDLRKHQPLIFPAVLMERVKTHTSEAKSCSLSLLKDFYFMLLLLLYKSERNTAFLKGYIYFGFSQNSVFFFPSSLLLFIQSVVENTLLTFHFRPLMLQQAILFYFLPSMLLMTYKPKLRRTTCDVFCDSGTRLE